MSIITNRVGKLEFTQDEKPLNGLKDIFSYAEKILTKGWSRKNTIGDNRIFCCQ